MNAMTPTIPFDTAQLDELLDAAGIDVLVVSSKHNIQYLLGGYRFFFFDYTDAIGLSRYLPLLVYAKGSPERSAYVGNSMESWEKANDRFWVPEVETRSWGTRDAMERAVEHIRKLGKGSARDRRRARLPPGRRRGGSAHGSPACNRSSTR